MSPLHIRPIARRRFVQGLAIGGAVAGFAPALLARSAPTLPAELSGTEFDLEIAELPVNFTGKRRIATAVNGACVPRDQRATTVLQPNDTVLTFQAIVGG